jgi:hypothetical protein
MGALVRGAADADVVVSTRPAATRPIPATAPARAVRVARERFIRGRRLPVGAVCAGKFAVLVSVG